MVSTQPVGTGPFVFKSWAPGDRLEMAKNPSYFEQGLPKLDAVTMRIIPEAAARARGVGIRRDRYPLEPALRGGRQVQEPSQRARRRRLDRDLGRRHPQQRAPALQRRARAPGARSDHRQGRLVQLALFGQGEPTHSPIPPSHPYFNKTLGFKKPDIARAKKLLAEAGHPNGFDVTMQVPQEREQRVRLGVAVRDMARAAGIRINVERVPFASYAAQVAGKAQMYVDGYFARPTIDTAIYPFYHSSGSWNRQLWLYKNERVDELLDTARKTNDEAKRKSSSTISRSSSTRPCRASSPIGRPCERRRKEVEGFRSTPMQWLELKEVTLKR